MARPRKDPNVFERTLSTVVSKAIDAIGASCEIEPMVTRLTASLKSIDYGESYAEIALRLAVRAEIDRQSRIRSMENPDLQGKLFGVNWLDKIIRYTTAEGNAAIVKNRHAVGEIQDMRREEEIRNIRRASRAFDLQEMRRDKIMPTLRANPTWTTERALEHLGLLELEPEPETRAA